MIFHYGRIRVQISAACLVVIALMSAGVSHAAELSILPAKPILDGPRAQQQLLVTSTSQEVVTDLTHKTTYRSLTPNIVTVTEQGVVKPVADGVGKIQIQVDDSQVVVNVETKNIKRKAAIDFENDIQPIFSRLGCNGGSCHGKQRGRGGFQLSMFAFDPQFDYDAVVKESRGRRVFPAAPDQSLLFQKATATVPHGGGPRLQRDSVHYNKLRQWINEGSVRSVETAPELVKVTAEPTERIMKPKSHQQMIVTGHYSDGSTRDITHLAEYQSSESVYVKVDEHGLVTAGQIMGEATIMARYLGKFALLNVSIPLDKKVPHKFYAALPKHNFIDGHVWNKLERLGLTPSPAADDATYLRRVFIDIIGRMPTAQEAGDYLADNDKNKRAKLVDYLLEQPEFADHWANKWADLLRPNPYRVGIKNVLNYDYWIRNSFRKNKPLDQFTRELLTAQGGSWHNGAVNLFRDRRSPDEITTLVTRIFLGTRLDCAKCHHHPSEVWGQDEFYSFAAYFAKIGRKGRGISTPISGSEEFVYNSTGGSVKHPITGAVMEPKPLFGKIPKFEADEDPRVALAEWITSPENHLFAQVNANRIWADMMGRGIVEPVDDIRASNPPSNAELLKALGNHFRDVGFDMKKFIRTIATSYVYGLSSLPSDTNVVDNRNYSRYLRQRLRAEVLLDSVTQITKVTETFSAMPPGSEAKQIWTHRIKSLFLDSFGRPDLNQDPPCERGTESTVIQVLHLMNSKNLYNKVTNQKGRCAELAGSDLSDEAIIKELYLWTYSRYPSSEELQTAKAHFAGKTGKERQSAVEDLLWILMNTPEFVIKD